MLTAARAVSRSAASSDPLPDVPALAALVAAGVQPRRGTLILIAALPKAGKSNFVMWWVKEMGLPSLYFSADMNGYDATTRLSASVTGHNIETVRKGIASPSGAAFYEDALEEVPIQWCFDSSPTVEDLWLELDAYVEAYDAYPKVIVVDTLMKVQASEEYAGQQYIMAELSAMARVTGAAVFVLHHCSEDQWKFPALPPKRAAIMNKVSQLPELILTVALDGTLFHVAPVGNRSGFQDPEAKHYVTLDADIAHSRFNYHNPYAYSGYGGYTADPEGD